jgi:hypothetical protein
MTQGIRLFFSYSHQDEALRDELAKHLSLLERDGVLRSWHDRQIVPGSDWAGHIDQHLEQAQIILLLISADFLASDYCYDGELNRALERHEAGEAGDRWPPIPMMRGCPCGRSWRLRATLAWHL